MTNWGAYQPYVPPCQGPLHLLTRREARQSFEHLMRHKTDRIDELRRLTSMNGVHLSQDDAAVQDLNDWYRRNIQPDSVDPQRLRPLWYAVTNDVALFLGDTLINRFPKLRWEFFTQGKRNVSYHRAVIMGFSRVTNPRYNLDVDRLIATYGHQIIARENVTPDYFVSMLRAAAARV